MVGEVCQNFGCGIERGLLATVKINWSSKTDAIGQWEVVGFIQSETNSN